MMITIECYQRATGEYMRDMMQDLQEYTEWIIRAVNRGYKIERAGHGKMIVHGGTGTRDFMVNLITEGGAK